MRRLPALIRLLPLTALLLAIPARADSVVVVAHPQTPPLDHATICRAFLGKIIEVGGTPIIPVNLPPGTPGRNAFMALVMDQSDEKYIDYWTVRRYIGKGAPPREFASAGDALAFISRTPGAVGYAADEVVSGHAGENAVSHRLVIVLARP